jgi:hypothetical protein
VSDVALDEGNPTVNAPGADRFIKGFHMMSFVMYLP